MFLAYADESGDSGFDGTSGFSLAITLVGEACWLGCLNQLIGYRRFLKNEFGVRMHDELKAKYLVNNRGPFRNLSVSAEARWRIFRGFMRLQRKAGGFTIFAVFIDKKKILKQETDVREWAWTWAIQRLQTFATKRSDYVHILPDAGHGGFIRQKVRELRRRNWVKSAYTGALRDCKAERIIEDPSDRLSQHSLFVQITDLNAYAAYRAVHPRRDFASEMWDELDDARLADVNRIRGGPTGIVVWP
jgi:hypothetical protein